MPVNLVTHAHGQGYADPNFLIPETVERVELFKGPYFPQFGDFATAGALKIVTKDEFKENFALAEGGSFDTAALRARGVAAARRVKTLFAGQAYYTNGPFDNPEHLARYNGFAQLHARPDARVEALGHRAGLRRRLGRLGQIPAPRWPSGALDRFGSIDPTEGGRTDRENLLLDWTLHADAQDTWEVSGYG